MTDRELAQKAAKAAGYALDEDLDRTDVRDNGGGPLRWNPLDDDGDALRLAVRLGIRVDPSPRGCCAVWPCPQGLRVDTLLNSVTGTDSCATTRRVIVIAAAKMADAAGAA